MQTFKALLHHDGGTAKISVIAQDIDTAAALIMKAENCPLCAIEFYC